MNIGIIGSGSMGQILGRGFISHGHEVCMANSRGPQSLSDLSASIGIRPVDLEGAVSGQQLVILAIPTVAVPRLSKDLFNSLDSSTFIIDICNYYPELRDGNIPALDEGMFDSHWVSQQIGVSVLKAFNNIVDQSLASKGTSVKSFSRIALPVSGGSLEQRLIVMDLIDAIGFEPFDAGEFEESWRHQMGTPAYCRDLNSEELKGALAQADSGRLCEYRRNEEARVRKLLGLPS